jgi:hypothetical protein
MGNFSRAWARAAQVGTVAVLVRGAGGWPDRFWLTFACLLVLDGCSEDTDDTMVCTLEARAGLQVTVLGAANPDGGTITVTITDGDYEEELSCGPEGASLVCSGATERPGTYRIDVIANGDVVATEEITIGADECHVIPEQVEI